MGSARAVALVLLVASLALLPSVLPGTGAQATHGPTPGQVDFVSIDMNPSAYPANTATSLGSRQACARQSIGATFDIDVTIDEVDPSDQISSFSFELNYDPTRLKVVGNNVNQMLAASGGTILDLSDPVPDSDGTFLTAAADMTGPHESGTGVLARITLQSIGVDTSALSLTNVQVADAIGSPVPVMTVQNALEAQEDLCPGFGDNMSTIAFEGDTVTVSSTPFRPSGAYSLTAFGNPDVNDSGDVVFIATTSGAPPPEPCVALMGDGTAPPSVVAADGDEAPSPFTPQPLNLCDPPFTPPSSEPLVNNNGDVAYQARLMTDGHWALWVKPFGAPFPIPVVVEGDPTPTPGVYGKPELLDFNDNGYVLFQASDSGNPTLWLWDTSTVSKVVAVGDALPSGGGTVSALGGGAGGGWTASMNASNDVAWRVSTSGGGGGSGGSIYSGLMPSPSRVVEAGDTWFSGPPVGDVNFTAVSEPRILADGSVAFRASADPPYGEGYFLARPDGSGGYTYEKQALEADPDPETGAAWGSLDAPGARYSPSDGEVMLSAYDGTSSEVLYLYPSYRRLVAVGDSSPQGPAVSGIGGASSSSNGNGATKGRVYGPKMPCTQPECDVIWRGPYLQAHLADRDEDGILDMQEGKPCGIDTNFDGNWEIDFDLDNDGNCDTDPYVPDIFVEVDYMDCTVASNAPDNNDPKDLDKDGNVDEPDGIPDDDLPASTCGGGDTHNHKPSQAAINALVSAFADSPVFNIYSNEDGVASCADGVDNGNDGFTDSQDLWCHTDLNPANPGSYDASRVEDQVIGTCNNGVDDGADGDTDRADPDCTGVNLHVIVDEAIAHADYLDFSSEHCSNGRDDDGDGQVDNIDPNCNGGAGPIPCKDGIGFEPNHSSFELVKGSHFGSPGDSALTVAAKKTIFHYALFVHQQDASTTSSGCGEEPGNDFFVSLGGWSQVGTSEQQSAFMHELGHNLNLCHGGPKGIAGKASQCEINYKPNYLSVMNYTFNFPWTPDGHRTNRPLDYSRVALPPCDPAGGQSVNVLNENGSLFEGQGIDCGNPNNIPSSWPNTAYTYVVGGAKCPFQVTSATGGIDWDHDGTPGENNVTATINDPVVSLPPPYPCYSTNPSPLMSLVGYNDWPNLLYNVRKTGGYGDGLPSAPVPPDEGGIAPPPDSDGDGWHDGQDVCTNDPNDDADSDGICVGDGFLAPMTGDNDNCPSTPNPGQENQDGDQWGDACETADCVSVATVWVTPVGDQDCDSWTTTLESGIGTLPLVACPATAAANDEDPDAWPPDTNDDRFVNISDVNSLRPPVFNLLQGRDTIPPNPSYSQRKDLNNDGFINISDVNAMRPPIFNLLTPCTP